MKECYVNFRFEYKGFGIHDSWCVVVVWEHKHNYLVILTEPDAEDSGTSVTNDYESIATKLYNQEGVFKKDTIPTDIVWVEHYPEGRRTGWLYNETYDLVELECKKRKFGSPKWTRIGDTLTQEKIMELLNEHMA